MIENIIYIFHFFLQKVTEMRNVTAKDLMDRTRNIIKGVRMNKRAALMLQNRNIDEED